ncbi:MAG TPA: DUF4396 domain-containing protein, partial [Halothiobacillaceae bacterium]|nr:DUF4396 domain-containing protein [Halothiobacillaceae bacterium]
MIPNWFSELSVAMLLLGGLSSIVITVDLPMGHRQHMWIMNVVWPVTALFGTVVALWAYFRWGRLATREKMGAAMERDQTPSNRSGTPFAVMAGKG